MARKTNDRAGEPNARAAQPSAAVWCSPSDLKRNPKNPRQHGPEVVRLARTILRTTWGAPVIAQARTRRVIGGHGRLDAAALILEGIEVDGELRGGPGHYFAADAPGPGLVPVRVLDVGDAEADALTLADNSRALQGEDDAAATVAMAAQFGRDSALLADIGMSAGELDALVKSAGDAVMGATQSDGPTDREDAATGQLGALQFRVVVDCDGEEHQAELLERLEAEGLRCRPLMS